MVWQRIERRLFSRGYVRLCLACTMVVLILLVLSRKAGRVRAWLCAAMPGLYYGGVDIAGAGALAEGRESAGLHATSAACIRQNRRFQC